VDVIQQVVNEFKSLIEGAGMELEYKRSKPIIIHANPIIREVFRNYISNALKYAREGKKIVINQELTDSRVTVSVIDFGTTIPSNEYDNIFVRSIQLAEGRKQGRGLGLAIVRRIAKAHGAEVGVKSNQPSGNMFYIGMPCAQPG